MSAVILWLLASEFVGLAVFPLCYYLLPRLSDRGFAVSKIFGLLLVSYLSWILSVLRILPSTQLTIIILILVIGSFSLWYMWVQRSKFRTFFFRNWPLLLGIEGLFLGIFLLWTIYRAYDPSINHTEQPMDLMFLNASVQTVIGIPQDPWLQGESVSYYYFGYWIMGILSKLSGVYPNVAYNLALSLIPALGAVGIFSLVHSIVASKSQNVRRAVVAGLASAFLLVGVGNLEGVLEFMRSNGMGSKAMWEWVGIEGLDSPAPIITESWRPQEFYWWWRATRVISTTENDQLLDYTIHEFPFFSYILGDLHPHVMSLPLIILLLTMCWNYLRSPPNVGRKSQIFTCISIAAFSLSLGGLGFTNMWDMPVFGAALISILIIKSHMVRGTTVTNILKHVVPVGFVICLLTLILISPYLLTFTSQVKGIGTLGNVSTRPFHMLLVWSLFLVAVTPFILGTFWQTTVEKNWLRISSISISAGFSPFVIWVLMYLGDDGTLNLAITRLITTAPFLLLISITIYNLLWMTSEPNRGSVSSVFALTLSALGLLLIVGPEMLYVNDSFGDSHERMNTVFKLYYQSWIVLSIASGFAVNYWISLRHNTSVVTQTLRVLWGGVFVVLLVGATYYSLAAAATKGDLFQNNPTLDGLAFTNDEEYGVIKYLTDNARNDSAVLEAIGEDYSEYGRISASTGIPTILGWPGHEEQWRGSVIPLLGRKQDVNTLYTTTEVNEAKYLLTKYGINYVFVGTRERQNYPSEGLEKFRSFMQPVFDQGETILFHWNLKP